MEKSRASAVPVTLLYLERMRVRTRSWWWSFFSKRTVVQGDDELEHSHQDEDASLIFVLTITMIDDQ